MVKRKNRLLTDFMREVRRTYSRFLSILLLSALAVAFLVGLRATARICSTRRTTTMTPTT